ncbi:hypothetical protein NQ314_015005 [Rhamnusium bicolor]|uniref:Helicase C-terminal domain-containing protein n=1 Tax=Rhamnusium bicolor TaxID=1586634 RepID=A0AAV8X0G6_9CUCU|nr:hypothetical protein NQ314_015005 [Rhamnusium bicolor]
MEKWLIKDNKVTKQQTDSTPDLKRKPENNIEYRGGVNGYSRRQFIMGRQKNIPKKCNKAEDHWNIQDNGFIPVIRKRKIRKNLKTSSININLSIKKQFNIGKLLIGTTNNVFPDDYNKCKITFNRSLEGDNEELETVIIECDDSSIILIKLTIDAEFFKELCKTKVLALIFETINEEVFVDIYFAVLPLSRFAPSIGNCIKNIFKLIYNIEMDTAFEFTPSKCEENLHGNTEIFNLYKKISTTRENKLILPDDENVQHPCLKPKLRPYQEKAVRWMLYREKIIDDKIDVLHPLYTTVVLKSGENVYYDKYTGYIDITKPIISPCIRGGIVADEMGLGKTVEVFACILLNKKVSSISQVNKDDSLIEHDSGELKKSPIIDRQRKKRKIDKECDEKSDNIYKPKKLKIPNDWVKPSSKKSSTWIALEMWYNSVLTSSNSTTQHSRNDDDPLVQCICGNTIEEGLIECDCCGKYQHRSCLGYNRTHGRYLCPQCWMDEPLLECGGTLIVTPLALRTQWCNEIRKHIKGGLKVLQYEGFSATPVYPTQLKEYDLVITTYKVLKAELCLTENGQILAPLLNLRHACTHPNTVRGRYLATKKQVTSMKDLLDALILKNTSDSEECLRLVISSLNGLAGIELLSQNPQKAIDYYREVLQLAARFSEDNKEVKLTVDKLQIIHTMYNLAEVLDICQPNQPTLRDGNLRKDCAELEQKYVEKFMNESATAFESSDTATAHVMRLQGHFVLKQGQWYSDGLDWTLINNYYEDLLEKIRIASENANVECNLRRKENEVTKMIRITKQEYYERQIDEHKKDRKEMWKTLKAMLKPLPKIDEESIYFENIEKENEKEIAETFNEYFINIITNVIDSTDKPIEDGETHITLIEALKKEFKEIRKLWTFLDQQICAQDEVDICKVRLQLKDPNSEAEEKQMSKTIKNLTYNLENKNETVNLISLHELTYQNMMLKREVSMNMKKLEKSLGTQSYLETLRKQQYEGQSPDPCPICKINLDMHWSILPCGHSYCLECIQILLEKASGEALKINEKTVRKIAKNDKENVEPQVSVKRNCKKSKTELHDGVKYEINNVIDMVSDHKHISLAILLEELKSRAIVDIGHTSLYKNVGDCLQCSVCRSKQKYQDISCIKAGNTVTDDDCKNIKGNYSTKIEAIIKLILDLKTEDINVKILLFSSWVTVLKCLTEALMTNHISCELATTTNLEARIERFKNIKQNITVLLLPIALGSKGLNLVEATHVILTEPLLNPADELQAVGRVHRIGQRKPTTVHKFLIKHTIEESIYQATTSCADNWDKNKVTLQQLTDLFANDMIPQEISDETSQEVSISSSSINEEPTSTA